MKKSFPPVSPTRTITPTGGLTDSIMVYYNGIMLKETNDYTVSGGTITLDSNLTVAQNDIVDVKIFSTFIVYYRPHSTIVDNCGSPQTGFYYRRQLREPTDRIRRLSTQKGAYRPD